MREMLKMPLQNYRAKIYTVRESILSGQKEVDVMILSVLPAEMTNVLNVVKRVTLPEIVEEGGQVAVLEDHQVADVAEEEDEVEEDILEIEVVHPEEGVGVVAEAEVLLREGRAAVEVDLEAGALAVIPPAGAEVEAAVPHLSPVDEMIEAEAEVVVEAEVENENERELHQDLLHTLLAGLLPPRKWIKNVLLTTK